MKWVFDQSFHQYTSTRESFYKVCWDLRDLKGFGAYISSLDSEKTWGYYLTWNTHDGKQKQDTREYPFNSLDEAIDAVEAKINEILSDAGKKLP